MQWLHVSSRVRFYTINHNGISKIIVQNRRLSDARTLVGTFSRIRKAGETAKPLPQSRSASFGSTERDSSNTLYAP